MPVSTEISNLERRGHVFYWRARVPSGVPGARTPQGKYARFSLSLHQSDHRRACYMARRLNTLLAELTLGIRAAMTDKEKLEAIFRAEIERMSNQLDDVVMMARRAGRTDDVGEMEADIEVGWANRLIQLYGSARKLTFQEGCPGRALLLRAGIPADHIPIIADTFEGECKYARSQMFETEIRSLMEQAGIANTIPNRERCKVEFFRARADALLNVGDRWPLTDPQSTALTRSTLSETERRTIDSGASITDSSEGGRPPELYGAPSIASGLQSATSTAGNSAAVSLHQLKSAYAAAYGEARPTMSDPAIGSVATGVSAPASAHKATSVPPTEGAEPAVDHRASVDASSVTSAISTIRPEPQAEPRVQVSRKPVLMLSAFMAEYQKMTSNRREEWRATTAEDARVLVCLFRDILEEHGIVHSGEIQQQHVAALRDHFNRVPSKYGQSSRLRAMTPKQLRDFAAAEVRKNPQYKVGLSSGTIRKHWSNLGTFLKHIRGQGYDIAEFNLADLRPAKPSKRGLRARQPKPHDDEVRPLFRLPIFTGCLGPDKKERGVPGPHVYHSALYFVPMFFVYLGARRAEIAGLDLSAVINTAHGPAINLEPTEVRSLKTAQSERLLPVPKEMLRLGFIDYVERLKELGQTMLFPELFSPFLERQDPGDRLYKELLPIVKKSPEFADGVWPRLIHALRHGFADAALQKGMDSLVIDDISGRMGNTETSTRYTNMTGLPRIIRELEAHIPIVTDHLQPQPLKLLPWVEAMQPPPWAGRKMTQKQLAGLGEVRRTPSDA